MNILSTISGEDLVGASSVASICLLERIDCFDYIDLPLVEMILIDVDGGDVGWLGIPRGSELSCSVAVIPLFGECELS